MRRDPVGLLEEQAQTRLPELVPIRYGRMLVSPFAFFRGAAYLMAADLADGPRTGLHAQLCGDAHLSNFGIFAAPDRRLVFSINDFDETLPGPVRVGRQAARRELRGRGPGSRLRRCDPTRGRDGDGARVPRGDGALRGDAEHRRLVHAPRRRGNPRPARVGSVRQADEALPGERRQRRARRTACARSRSCAGRSTASCGSSATLRSSRRSRTCCRAPSSEHLEDVVRRMIRTYRRTLPRDRRHLLESYRYVHAARKVVGVGSVGARTWILLFVGRDDSDPLFLQFKEAQASVLEPFLGRSQYAQHGQRVVEGQRMMQAAADIMLGGSGSARSTASRGTSTSGSSGTRRARPRSS